MIKLLEEITGKTFSDIDHSNGFSGQSPKAIEMKIKTNKWGLIRLTIFCTAKEIITKQPMEWEKIFANNVTKGLISKIYNQLIQLNNKRKQTAQSKNGPKT